MNLPSTSIALSMMICANCAVAQSNNGPWQLRMLTDVGAEVLESHTSKDACEKARSTYVKANPQRAYLCSDAVSQSLPAGKK